MTDALRCKYPQPTARCDEPPAYRLVHTLTRGGCQFTDVFCRGHVDRQADRIREAGGSIVAVEDLPPPPTPMAPEPVGLDAIDPTVPKAEPSDVGPPEHLGNVVAADIYARGWTAHEAASLLNWHPDLLAQVVEGTQDVKEGMAEDLARVFGLTAGAWLRLQAMHGRSQARQAMEV